MPVNKRATKKDVINQSVNPIDPAIEQSINQSINAQIAEAEFLRARIIDVSLAEKHQSIEIETLENKLASVTQSFNQSINQSNSQSNAAPLVALQQSLSAMDVRTAALQQEILDLHQSFNAERNEAEKVFDAALIDQSMNFNQSLLSSQKSHLLLVEQMAKINSFADIQSNMQARLNEFHRRVEEQRRLHADKCSSIWTRWCESKATLESEHDRRKQETEEQYKATAMKMMNISYGPMNADISEYRNERINQLRIIDELNAENKQFQVEFRDLVQLKQVKQAELDTSMVNLFEIKLAIKQAKKEENEYVIDKLKLEQQAADKQELDDDQRRKEIERLDRELYQYDQASLITQVNVNRLLTCIDRAEFQRANHPLERVLIESINQVKAGRRISVNEFLPAERMAVLASVLNKMTQAERVRYERSSDRLIDEESKVEVALSSRSRSDEIAVPHSITSDWATSNSFDIPVESSDGEGSFFLTQME